MPNFFRKLANFAGPMASTSPHRNSQFGNMIAFGVGAAIETPAATISATVVQSASSAYSMLHVDTEPSEKCIHLAEVILALVRFGLAIALLIERQECRNDKETICQMAYIFQLIYVAVLSISLTASKFSKAPKASPADVPTVPVVDSGPVENPGPAEEEGRDDLEMGMG